MFEFAKSSSLCSQMRMSLTTIRSSVGWGRLDPPSVECIRALMYRATIPLINKMEERTRTLTVPRLIQISTILCAHKSLSLKKVSNPDDDAFIISDQNQVAKPKTSIERTEEKEDR
ncbi:unnamed protein product [Brassica oleracea var. botrytis]